jgi:kynurenine formamidase
VPPAYALPPEGFDNDGYSAEVREWLADYEKEYGPRGTSDMTTEKIPLDLTCGPARVIDVRRLVGTTKQSDWPRSPEVTVAHIQRYEEQHGDLKPGQVVLFRSDYTDNNFKSLPEGEAFMSDPLNGKREGWPAIGPDAIVYLAKKGIRCLGTDASTLGGVDSRRACMTYWALGSKGMVGVEFLTGLGKLPNAAYFIFAPLKIRGCHGGPGRAIAFW